jgi:hypothetical protein
MRISAALCVCAHTHKRARCAPSRSLPEGIRRSFPPSPFPPPFARAPTGLLALLSLAVGCLAVPVAAAGRKRRLELARVVHERRYASLRARKVFYFSF